MRSTRAGSIPGRLARATVARTMINRVTKGVTAAPPSKPPRSVGQNSAGRDEHPAVGRVLRQARTHHQLSLREVERRIGRSNAYLSQVERGLIKHPDPSVLLELAELYGLNFMTLVSWAGWSSPGEDIASGQDRGDSTRILVRHLLDLDAAEREKVSNYIEQLRRDRRT